jgi:hypothetical protein
MIKCKTYPLTKPEMEAAKKFLDENQAMGYIEPTNSPYSSPFFFIKKRMACCDQYKTTMRSTNG